MLHGPVQSSYRAEVRAALHVVRTACDPCLIMIDCKSVVTIFNEIMQERKLLARKLHEEDLWAEITFLVQDLPKEFFIAQWMPSHLDEPGNEKKRAIP